MRDKEFDPKEIRKSMKKDQNNSVLEEKRNKTVTKESKIKETRKNDKSEKKISFINEANNRRKSMHVPLPRYSTKYIFKSTKKAVTQEIV